MFPGKGGQGVGRGGGEEEWRPWQTAHAAGLFQCHRHKHTDRHTETHKDRDTNNIKMHTVHNYIAECSYKVFLSLSLPPLPAIRMTCTKREVYFLF